MEMRDFILHRDILSVEVKIDGNNYRFGVRWKTPEKPYGDTWILQSLGKGFIKRKNQRVFRYYQCKVELEYGRL